MGANTLRVLNKWADYMVEITRKRLTQGNKSATGNLIRSLDYKIKNNNGLYEMILTGKPHLLNVDRGRRVGAIRPPIKAIEAWIKVKRIKIDIPKNAKNKQLVYNKSVRGMAFAIATNISKRGIRPFPIINTAAKVQSRPGFKKELAEAIKLDMVKQLNIIFK